MAGFAGSKGVLVVLSGFLVLQMMFFYNTTLYLGSMDQAPDGSIRAQADGRCENVIPSNSKECHGLDMKQCDYRSDCYSIRAQRCGSVVGEETFIQCVPKHEAVDTPKMELNPRLPDWSYGHSDMKSICAHAGGEEQQIYRFGSIVPAGWEQVKCVKCVVHPPEIPRSKRETGLTLIALVHKEFDSFNNSVHSWRDSGLLDYADETILWINHKSPDQDPIEELAESFGLKILSSETNLGIGPAVSNLVLAAKNPLVIFLEKDFEVVEPHQTVVDELEYAKRLVLSHTNGSRADAVKLRSRWNAGVPNIQPGLCYPPPYDMVELNDYAQYRWIEQIQDHQWWLPHLFCNIFHFEQDKDLLRTYPNRIWKCGNAICFDSAQCGWTNNPILFKKHWFLDTLYEISQREDNPTFEGGTYYSTEWVEPHWVIAETEGIFRHHEINEH